MKIAIDARALSHPQPGGFKTYTTNLVHALLVEDPTNEYVLYLDRPLANNALPRHPKVSLKIIRPIAGWAGVPVREQVWLPLHLRRHSPDIAHFPCATGPAWAGCPLVVTIHDTIGFFETRSISFRPLKELLRRTLMGQYNKLLQRVVARRADIVITDSAHSRSDIVDVLGIPSRKIWVIPISQADIYGPCKNISQIKELQERYELPTMFILALVSASPRKNASGLLRIYAKLPDTLRDRYPLVMVWTHPLLQPEIEKEVERLGLKDHVCFLSRVPDQDLVLLYNAATVFVFPSLYEGFGLPVLEAMACGTPVVASNRTSIPEVAGNAAELVDPLDEDAFAQVLVDVLTSPERQAALAEAGLRRARQFSWRHTAKQTLEVYQHVVQPRL